MQNAPLGAFCNTFTFIKLPFVIEIFVLFIFEWLFYTGFTVFQNIWISLLDIKLTIFNFLKLGLDTCIPIYGYSVAKRYFTLRDLTCQGLLCCLLIKVRPGPDPNCDSTLMIFLKEFLKKLILKKKISISQKSPQHYPACNELTHKAPPIICSRRQYQILMLFQK